MKKAVILSIIIFLSGFVVNSYAQTKSSSNTGDEKIVTPKGNTLVVKKRSNTESTKVREKETPGNTEKYRKENGVPEDFPKYKNTGNSKLDADRYYQAKQEWIKLHPVEFQKIKHLTL